jgi:hypothetical protein
MSYTKTVSWATTYSKWPSLLVYFKNGWIDASAYSDFLLENYSDIFESIENIPNSQYDSMLFPDLNLTVKSEAHYTWFLLQQ